MKYHAAFFVAVAAATTRTTFGGDTTRGSRRHRRRHLENNNGEYKVQAYDTITLAGCIEMDLSRMDDLDIDFDGHDIDLDKLDEYDGKIKVGISEVFLSTTDSAFAMALVPSSMEGGNNRDQASLVSIMSEYRNEEEQTMYDSYGREVNMNELNEILEGYGEGGGNDNGPCTELDWDIKDDDWEDYLKQLDMDDLDLDMPDKIYTAPTCDGNGGITYGIFLDYTCMVRLGNGASLVDFVKNNDRDFDDQTLEEIEIYELIGKYMSTWTLYCGDDGNECNEIYKEAIDFQNCDDDNNGVSYITDEYTGDIVGMTDADGNTYEFNGEYNTFYGYEYEIENLDDEEEVCSLLSFLYYENTAQVQYAEQIRQKRIRESMIVEQPAHMKGSTIAGIIIGVVFGVGVLAFMAYDLKTFLDHKKAMCGDDSFVDDREEPRSNYRLS